MANVPPDDKAAGNDIESPADGPTPDWMRLATSSSSSSLTEDKTPNWLKNIRAGKSMAQEQKPAKTQPPTPPPAAKADSSETMSDLERLLAEEGIDLGSVAEERPSDATNMSARDWLIATSSEEMIRKKLGAEPIEPELPPASPQPHAVTDNDKMVVEEDLPDWLREYSAEADQSESNLVFETPPSSVSTASSEPDQFVVEADLPDWLQEIATESETSAETEPILPDFMETPPPPTTPSTSAMFDEDKMVVEEDLPDWLREVAEEPAVPEPAQPLTEIPPAPPIASSPTSPSYEDKMIVEEDLPDWLREFASEEPVVTAESESAPPLDKAPVTPVISQPASLSIEDKMIVEEDLPDWLREVEETSAEADLSLGELDLDTLPSDEGLPDWLREVEKSSFESDLLAAAPELSLEPAAEPSFEAEEENLPDWLKETQEREVEPKPEGLIAQPISRPDTGLVVEEELPDWLREVQEESTPLTFESIEPMIATAGPIDEGLVEEEGLPDWLQEVQAGEEEPFEPSEPSPEPFIETTAVEELVIEEELPDWLQEVQAETAEETPAFVTPVMAMGSEPVGVSTDTMIDEESLPDWLREVETEIEPEAEVEPAPTPQPTVTVTPIVQALETPPVMEELAEEIGVVEEVVRVETAPEPVIEISEPVPQPMVTPKPTAIPDWLQKLREVELEEEPSLVPIPVMPAAAPAFVAKPAPLPVTARPTAARLPEPELPADAQERLSRARAARDKGAIEEAVPLYDSLIANNVFLNKIIEDMQQAIKAHPSSHLLYQVMGDAMVRDGRLQSALNAYRDAMAKL